MSGENEHHCRIGKVTLKPKILQANIVKRAPGRVRGLFVEAIRSVDMNAENGVHPIAGFFGLVNSDGTVNITNRFNVEATDGELSRLNWRNMAMLFEDAAQDCRNFSVYHQRTTYDIINEVGPEGAPPSPEELEEEFIEDEED